VIEFFLESSTPDWFANAACRRMGPDPFFTELGEWAKVRKAKAICWGCPVRSECLEYAQRNYEDFGIWGGYGMRERKLLRSRAARERQAS